MPERIPALLLQLPAVWAQTAVRQEGENYSSLFLTKKVSGQCFILYSKTRDSDAESKFPNQTVSGAPRLEVQSNRLIPRSISFSQAVEKGRARCARQEVGPSAVD